MDVLQQIMAERAADVAEARAKVSMSALEAQLRGLERRSLVERLRTGTGTRIIAEVKKASPSAGLLREHYDPAQTAAGYHDAGAIGISVLTEPRHFMGDPEHLQLVRDAVPIPALRKDFIVDAYHVAETAAMGADVMLLIVAGLDPSQMLDLHAQAIDYGLEVIVESHTERELELALECEGAIVGVNSRDLKTLRTDLAVARRLFAEIPSERLALAESGIKTRADIASLEALGYDGFLIGESLLRETDPGEALRGLVG